MSAIEWTDRTWNPVRGCSRVSEGCRNCYAERTAARFGWVTTQGTGFNPDGTPDDNPTRYAEMTASGPHWTGHVELVPHKLEEPLHWKKPARVFVNSMSDLFHEALPDESIIAVFNVMRQCPQHTFQIMTKRAERMRDFCSRVRFDSRGEGRMWLADAADGPGWRLMGGGGCSGMPWVWLGVSVEDQATADARIPLLLETPAAVRFVSAEPLLGPVDFKLGLASMEWVIVGGESGPGARPFDVAWARSIVAQCSAFSTACFVKQFGRHVYDSDREMGFWNEIDKRVVMKPDGSGGQMSAGNLVLLKNPKGGDPEEWPESLRVREFPTQEARDAH